MTNKLRWKIRRRVVVTSLLFCGCCVTYLMLYGEDTQLNNTIANGVIFLAGTIIGSYVFGATWDSKGIKDYEN